MVVCSCGKTIDKLPLWLADVHADFVCTNCPNRKVKSITQLTVTDIVPNLPRSEEETVLDFEDAEEEA